MRVRLLDNAMLKDIASKKMVTPAVRREAVAHLQVTYQVSERRACSALGADARRCAIAVAALTTRRRE
jgi:hypothetical protein